MDCCSADGYAATYTELLKKLTANNEFLSILFVIVVVVIVIRLFPRIKDVIVNTEDKVMKKDN